MVAPATRAWNRIRPGGLFYGWYIVAAGAVNIALVTGITAVGFTLFIDPIRRELGWSVTAIAAGYSIRSFESGLLSPFTGNLLDRFGPRRMAIIGITISALGLALFSQIEEIWQYYLASLVLALGQSLGAAGGPFSLAVMQWFSRKRGRAAGLMNIGNGGGYLVVPIIAVLLGAFGWRETLLILAGAVLVICLPLAMVLRWEPERYGYRPDGGRLEPATAGEGGEVAAVVAVSGASVREALHTPAFYFLMLAAVAGGATVNAWLVHLVPHLTNEGFSTATASLFVAAFGVVGMGTRVGVGWFGDRLGRRNVFMFAHLFFGVGFTVLAFLGPDRLYLVPIYFAAMTTGMAGFSVLGQTMVADYFGTRRFGTIRGLNQTLSMPFGIGVPILAGWMFDHYGNYHLAFLIIAVMAASGFLWVFLAGKPSGRYG